MNPIYKSNSQVLNSILIITIKQYHIYAIRIKFKNITLKHTLGKYKKKGHSQFCEKKELVRTKKDDKFL